MVSIMKIKLPAVAKKTLSLISSTLVLATTPISPVYCQQPSASPSAKNPARAMPPRPVTKGGKERLTGAPLHLSFSANPE